MSLAAFNKFCAHVRDTVPALYSPPTERIAAFSQWETSPLDLNSLPLDISTLDAVGTHLRIPPSTLSVLRTLLPVIGACIKSPHSHVVYLCGSCGLGVGDAESDVDLAIVTAARIPLSDIAGIAPAVAQALCPGECPGACASPRVTGRRIVADAFVPLCKFVVDGVEVRRAHTVMNEPVAHVDM